MCSAVSNCTWVRMMMLSLFFILSNSNCTKSSTLLILLWLMAVMKTAFSTSCFSVAFQLHAAFIGNPRHLPCLVLRTFAFRLQRVDFATSRLPSHLQAPVAGRPSVSDGEIRPDSRPVALRRRIGRVEFLCARPRRCRYGFARPCCRLLPGFAIPRVGCTDGQAHWVSAVRAAGGARVADRARHD